MMEIRHGTAGPMYGEVRRSAVLEAMASTPAPTQGRGGAGTAAVIDGLARQRRGARHWWLLICLDEVDTLDRQTAYREVGREILAARIVAAARPTEIVAVLRLAGKRRLADRVKHLSELVEDDPDEPPIVFPSLRELALFLVSDRRFGDPEVGLSPDGLLQAEWPVKNGGVLVMNFLPDGMIQFAAVANSAIRGDRRRRVNGTLPKDEALSAVRQFIR